MSGKTDMIGKKDQRRCPRIESENRVGYVLYNEMRNKVDQGSGKTVNLSQTGILLQTQKPLNGAYIVLVTIDLEGNPVRVKGKVINTRYMESSGCYLTGVDFIGPKEEQLGAIVAFVKAYQRRKHQTVQ